MADAAPIVEPRPGAVPPPPADATQAEAPTGGVDLPDALINIPAVQAITAGQPGAFSAILTEFEKVPEAKIIAKNKDNLMKAGFGFYRSLDGQKGVVFNQLFVSPDEITAADTAGQLEVIAPPFLELNETVAKAGADNPVLAEGERPTGFKSGTGAPASAPIAAAPIRPLPAGAQKTLASRRATNLQPGAPTSGPAPGEGRLLASILKPVI